jgi:hypothetical protein
LNRWYVTLPPLDPFFGSKEEFATEKYWDTYLFVHYHTLYLTVLSHRFARVIEKEPMSHSWIYQAQSHANKLSMLFMGCSYHSQAFSRMAAIMAKCIFFSGVIHCALGHRDSKLVQNGILHLQFLKSDILAKNDLKTTGSLEKFTMQPFLAIEYLKKFNKIC